MNATPDIKTQLLIEDWVRLFEKDYFSYRLRTPQSETTWRTHYLAIFRRLPATQKLSPQLLKDFVLENTQPDSRQRVRACQVLAALAKLAGLEFDTRKLKGKYNFRNTKPRQLPEDAVIAQCYRQICDPGWQWVYGMLATFGLRPHEVFLLDLTRMYNTGMVTVTGGKTGFRRVWSLYPEWVQEFSLCDVKMPSVSGRDCSDLGHRVAQGFRRAALPFKAYDLRHAWAVRSLEFGLELTLAAQQMGHSLEVHSSVYHHWISEKRHQEAFDKMIANPNRPMPPVYQL
jgi:integrase